MKLVRKIKRERRIRPLLNQGYTRSVANEWMRAVRRDNRRFVELTEEQRKSVHDRHYLCKSIEKYNLLNESECHYITDFDYMLLSPFNNSFTKWFDDLVTQDIVLADYRDCLPRLHFHIMPREDEKIMLPLHAENRAVDGLDAFFAMLNEKGALVLRPSAYSQNRSGYTVRRHSEGIYYVEEDVVDRERMTRFGLNYDKQEYIAPGYYYDRETLWKKMKKLYYDWVIAEPYRLNEAFGKEIGDAHSMLKLYIAARDMKTTALLDSYLLTMTAEEEAPRYISVDGESGSFVLDGVTHTVPGWSHLRERVLSLCDFTSQVQYVALYIVLTEDGFVIDYVDTNPELPTVAHSEALNDYLFERLETRKEVCYETKAERRVRTKEVWKNKLITKYCRPGIRPYMQKIWFDSVKDDLLHTKGANIFQKMWCWRHGFLSYRIWQYGVNKHNYTDFLSDYQYHWLNRINNQYQVWLNDKTTTRYILEPYKQYLSKYYYCILKQDDKTCIKALQDLPEGFGAEISDIVRLLKQEKYLALKPSAGTHGDGFYRLEYTDAGEMLVNGKPRTEQELEALIRSFRSYYLITEYLFMHDELRKIYPHSVNTVRMAVINQKATEPMIVQAYMRIGSSKTGFTDNVGYGGICTKIDIADGRYYCGEQITAHHFTPCPVHPDTGVAIEGYVPNWDKVCAGVLDICRYMPELEYLGFDIAVTNDGFRVIEVNIHQDLHKVAEHSEVFKQFYRDKLELKAKQYGLKKW